MEGSRFAHGTRAGQIVCATLATLTGGISVAGAVGGVWGVAAANATIAVGFLVLLLRSRRTGIWIHGSTVTVVQLIGSKTFDASDIERVERVSLHEYGVVGSHVGLVTSDGNTTIVNSVVWPGENHPGYARFAETLADLEAALADARRST